ncbi:MAG: hypothetical protein WA405_01230 [Candidatus Acidiferrales bacterium]
MRIGLVGYGTVGRSLEELFRRSEMNDLTIFDKNMPGLSSDDHKRAVNKCELAFVAVPTPPASDGLSADLSAVSEVVDWLNVPICIRSTIPPGSTQALVAATSKMIAFCPEYVGESPDHPWRKADDCGFLIVGGNAIVRDLVVRAYQTVVSNHFPFYQTDSTTAELCKYMENCFLAMKVAFVNQFYDIAQCLDVDFEQLRSLWLLDSRIGESHTRVTPARGFGGKCLPKDLGAIIALMSGRGGAALLESVHAYNIAIRKNVGAQSGGRPSPKLKTSEK